MIMYKNRTTNDNVLYKTTTTRTPNQTLTDWDSNQSRKVSNNHVQ